MADTLVVIAGPTAVGKSDVALHVAEALSCEIISADSRQVYQEMPIGTAAPSDADLSRVPHHLVRCRSVLSPLNAYDFEQEVLKILPGAFKRGGGVAVLAGGSMMYVDAVCRGIDPMPDVPPILREQLKAELEQRGLPHMVSRLQALDPDYCRHADLHNPRRVLHALELSIVSGKPVSRLRTGLPKSRPFRIIKFAISRPRPELYDRIDARVDQMLADGLIPEAQSLIHLSHLPALQTVGYRELFSHFRGELPLPDAISLIKRNTRHYAKKQITWLNADPDYISLPSTSALPAILNALPTAG